MEKSMDIFRPYYRSHATYRVLDHRTLLRNRTSLRAKNCCPQNPVLRFFNLFKERLTPLKVVFFLFN